MSLENRRFQSPDVIGVVPEDRLLRTEMTRRIGVTTVTGLYFAESAAEVARRQLIAERAQAEVQRRQALADAAAADAARQQQRQGQ